MCFAIADKQGRYCILQIVVYTKEQWASFKEKYPNAKNAKKKTIKTANIFLNMNIQQIIHLTKNVKVFS